MPSSIMHMIDNCEYSAGGCMAKAIEVIFEDNVFKPVHPVEGIQEHERMIAFVSRRPNKEGLAELAGTLSHTEAMDMQKMIDEEFGTLEGDW
ncbi:MAG TPA: antitoxin family protein [Methanospirillum sp.]|nr:antitoxin family protein [Methanospirillum sp.]